MDENAIVDRFASLARQVKEATAQLATISEKLDALEYRLDAVQERHEGWIEKRRTEIDHVAADLRDGLSDVRYEIDRIATELRSGSRRW